MMRTWGAIDDQKIAGRRRVVQPVLVEGNAVDGVLVAVAAEKTELVDDRDRACGTPCGQHGIEVPHGGVVIRSRDLVAPAEIG